MHEMSPSLPRCMSAHQIRIANFDGPFFGPAASLFSGQPRVTVKLLRPRSCGEPPGAFERFVIAEISTAAEPVT